MLNANETNNLSTDNKESIKEVKALWRVRVLFIVSIAILALLIINKLRKKEIVDSISTPVVNVITIQKGNIERKEERVGTIMPSNTFYVVNKVAGEITEIYVENGQRVKKGDKICDIDNQKQIDSAFIQYDTSRKTYERYKKLFAAGDISRQSFEQVEAQYEGYKLAYETQVEYATPVATGDGIIENTNMTLNGAISTGKVLCYITAEDAKEIQFGVTERVLNGINLYDTVEVIKGETVHDATVTDKSSLMDSSTGLFNVKAVINEKDINFASGANATVRFAYQKNSNTYILSRDLIYYDNTKPYVFVVDNESKLAKKFIETGIENDTTVEVLSGVTENDKIVSTWNNDLAEGVVVEIIDAASGV